MNKNCKWNKECIFCQTYDHCAVEVQDIYYIGAEIEIVHIYSPVTQDIYMKLLFDHRYYEEMKNPFLYIEDDKLHWGLPDNPYPIGTAPYANYQELMESLPPMKKLIRMALEASPFGVMDYHGGFYIKTEQIGDYNDRTGVAQELLQKGVIDSEIIINYYDTGHYFEYWNSEFDYFD